MSDQTLGGRISRRRVLGLAAAAVVAGGAALTGCGTDDSGAAPTTATPKSSARPVAVVYRTPSCGCCKSYEAYLRNKGFPGETKVLDDLEPIHAKHNIPADAVSCHTVLLDGYAVEGHVPVEAIDKMLAERPNIDGISIPGMPTNAPGMGEPDGNPIEVLSFKDGQTSPFVTL